MDRREFTRLIGISLLVPFAMPVDAEDQMLVSFRAVFENTRFHINPDTFYIRVNEKVYSQLKSLFIRDNYYRARRAVRLRRWLNERRNG